jgi:hypothetical protein
VGIYPFGLMKGSRCPSCGSGRVSGCWYSFDPFGPDVTCHACGHRGWKRDFLPPPCSWCLAGNHEECRVLAALAGSPDCPCEHGILPA